MKKYNFNQLIEILVTEAPLFSNVHGLLKTWGDLWLVTNSNRPPIECPTQTTGRLPTPADSNWSSICWLRTSNLRLHRW